MMVSSSRVARIAATAALAAATSLDAARRAASRADAAAAAVFIPSYCCWEMMFCCSRGPARARSLAARSLSACAAATSATRKRGRLHLGAPLGDQGIEARLAEHRQGVAAVHRVALVLEQALQPAVGEGRELELADLDRAGHLQPVGRAAAARGQQHGNPARGCGQGAS